MLENEDEMIARLRSLHEKTKHGTCVVDTLRINEMMKM